MSRKSGGRPSEWRVDGCSVTTAFTRSQSKPTKLVSRPNPQRAQRRSHGEERKGRSVHALCARTDPVRSLRLTCVHGAELVPASRLGKEPCALGAIHGSLSQPHRNRAACFLPCRLCFRFRLWDFADRRVRHQVGGSLLLRKHFRRLGVRASLRFPGQGARARTWRTYGALSGGDADIVHSRSGHSIVGPSSGPEAIAYKQLFPIGSLGNRASCTGLVR